MSFNPVVLGRTGIRAGRIGLASGYGAPEAAVEEAVERGVNYLYWGSFRRSGMKEAVRKIVRKIASDPAFDLFHIRYNAAHRGAETEIFPKLSPADVPGIVAFTATRWGQLINPKRIPDSVKTPSATDCYRFVLSHPSVHVCISGPKNLQQTRDALKALELGPMDHDELQWMRKVGDAVYGKKKIGG